MRGNDYLEYTKISIHAPREGCDSKSAQNALRLLRQNPERTFSKGDFQPKGILFFVEKRRRHVTFFQIVLFMWSLKVRTSRGFPVSFTFAQAENIPFSLCYTIKTSLGR